MIREWGLEAGGSWSKKGVRTNGVRSNLAPQCLASISAAIVVISCFALSATNSPVAWLYAFVNEVPSSCSFKVYSIRLKHQRPSSSPSSPRVRPPLPFVRSSATAQTYSSTVGYRPLWAKLVHSAPCTSDSSCTFLNSTIEIGRIASNGKSVKNRRLTSSSLYLIS